MSGFRQPSLPSGRTIPPVNESHDILYRAVESRDRRFEGRFVLAVKTTRIYCRPGCPAPLPKRENVLFLACAAAAEEAGFRPCRRCRPEAGPGTPAWNGTSATVGRALRLIAGGGLDGARVEALAERVGLGERHLRRLFAEQLGASPAAVARTRRVHFARRLLDETAMPVSEVAWASGFSSLRAFNEAMLETFGRPPTELRKRRRGVPGNALALRLPFRQPFAWEPLIGFLERRAMAGVERVANGAYRRTAPGGAVLTVRPDESGRTLVMEVQPGKEPLAQGLMDLVERVGRLFDLEADPRAIDAHLAADPLLTPLVAARPGLRVPGAFDPFETAVRGILGQQVSVTAARTLASRIAERFGERVETGDPALTRTFPTAERLAKAEVEACGLTSARGNAVRTLAKAVLGPESPLLPGKSLEESVARLTALPGIGPFTAHYVAMRVLREPDAFPAGDLGLRKAIGKGEAAPPREVEERAEAWRPFRAYAALHLWNSLPDKKETA